VWAVANGNTEAGLASGTGDMHYRTTMQVSEGEWYWEDTVGTQGAWGDMFGILEIDTGGLYSVHNYNGTLNADTTTNSTSGGAQGYGSGLSSGDTVCNHLDLESGEYSMKVNAGSWREQLTGMSGAWSPMIGMNNQTASFQGNWGTSPRGSGGNADDNGYGDFDYAPPTNALSLCTANMTALTFDPTAHVQPHTYDGTGSAKDETFTGASNLTSTDLVIIKNRDTADSAIFIDRVRGATKEIRFAAGSTSEATDPNGLDDLDVSNGFGLGTGAGGYNDSGEAFSAIGFYLDGTTGSTNNVGTIESVVSANDVSGVSVVKVVSGGGVAGTVGHGLTTEPGFILAKNLGSGAQGRYSSDAIGWTKGMYFPGGSAPTTGSGYFNDAAPGTARNYTFSVGTDDETSGSGDTIIYYCFASKPGVSYVESFTGNNSTDGSVINMGFKPSVVLLILASAGQMFWFDDLRDTYNAATNTQDLDGLSAEGTEGPIDFLSNGVKLRFAGGPNSGTNTIIAFARQPTLNKSGTPAKAR